MRFAFLLLCSLPAVCFAQAPKAAPADDLVQEEVTAEMREALEQWDEKHVPIYLKLTRNADPKVRVEAIRALTWGEKKSDAITTTVLARAIDPNAEVRATVLHYIGYQNLKTPAALAIIEQHLSDKRSTVVWNAIGSVGQMGNEHPELVLAMARRLPHVADRTAQNILSTLQYLPSVPAEAAPLIKHAVPKLGDDAIMALSNIKPPPAEFIPWLRDIMLNDDDDDLCEAAAWVLGRYGDAEFLLRQVKDGNFLERANGVHGLCGIEKPSAEVTHSIIAALDSGDDSMRFAAARGIGLGKKPADELVLALFRGCDDGHAHVRQHCQESLERLMYEEGGIDMNQALVVVDKALVETPNDIGFLIAKAQIQRQVANMLDYDEPAKSLGHYNAAAKGIVQVVLRSNFKLSKFERDFFAQFFFEAAQVATRSGNNPLALKYLQVACEQGWDEFESYDDHEDLAKLRAEEGYQDLRKKYEKKDDDE